MNVLIMSQDEIAKKIYNFLKENKERDYSVSEIAKALKLKRGVTGNLVRALTIASEIIVTRVVSKAVMYQYKEKSVNNEGDKNIIEKEEN